MALIRDIGSIARKWKEVTPMRSAEYKAGVEAPLKDWAKETLAAKDRQKEGMQKALADDRVAKGVAKATTARWQKKAILVGPSRWSEGVTVAEPEYTAGFAPFVEVIRATDPGPRFPSGDPRNWERSRKIGLALHAKKVGG